MRELRIDFRVPVVVFNGKGIGESWRDEFARTTGFAVSGKDPDCVVFMSESQLDPAVLGKVPTVCMFWGWPPGRFLDGGQEFLEHVAWQLEQLTQCTRVLTPSLVTRDQLAQFGIDSTILIPGVDAHTLEAPKVTHDWGQPLNPNIVFLSRLVPYKGLSILLDALEILARPPFLTVCGSGLPDYEKLARERGQAVRFIEPDDNEKVRLLAGANALVFPSYYEGFGLPPLEALYLGTPVISADIPQLRHLLQEDATYFSSVQGLAETIQEVVRYPGPVREMTMRGQKRVKGYLNLHRASQDLAEVIHEAIRTHLGGEIRQHPERVAEVYDRDHRRNWAFKTRYFDLTWERHWRAQHFIAELEKAGAKTILDCGSGAIYPTIFARAGFQVTAFDISREALDQAQVVAFKHQVKIATTQGQAEDLGKHYPQGGFDAVVLGEILEHVKNPRLVLEQAYQVIRPGGVVVCSTPIGTHHNDPLHIGPAGGGWDKGSLDKLLEGFTVVTRREVAEAGTDPSCYLFTVQKPL